jgi:hypothetical protein
VARFFTAAVLILTLVGCATYEGARQDVGTGVGKLGDWIKSDPKK